jgi:subfamily B ATP-binding cassette protein HlyB/CyaB
MKERHDDNGREIPLSWFGKTLWTFTPLYTELVFVAICLRLIGLVEPCHLHPPLYRCRSRA